MVQPYVIDSQPRKNFIMPFTSYKTSLPNFQILSIYNRETVIDIKSAKNVKYLGIKIDVYYIFKFGGHNSESFHYQLKMEYFLTLSDDNRNDLHEFKAISALGSYCS